RIGEFEMRKDEKFPVRISHDTEGKGNVAADAVKVEMVTSYEEPNANARSASATSSEEMRTASATRASVVQAARKYIGTPYGPKPHGGSLAYCRPYKLMDCSCLTRVAVYDSLRKTLPDDPTVQHRYGRYVAKASLRPGDLVFHKEAGASRPITSVGVYSGNGKFIHA
ncbi:MAG: NlpC/P60 family protein, partial [Actinomycetota bacterium]|nr:NlpC/P60 family protein [Actinomycetota bacterium]